jgi:hypothetical protein
MDRLAQLVVSVVLEWMRSADGKYFPEALDIGIGLPPP